MGGSSLRMLPLLAAEGTVISVSNLAGICSKFAGVQVVLCGTAFSYN